MTYLVITDGDVGETWINGTTGNRGTNYSGNPFIQVQAADRRGVLWPELPPFLGRTVVDAYAVGHARVPAGGSFDAGSYTLAPFTDRKQVGRYTWANQPAINAAAAVTTVLTSKSDGEAVTFPGLAAIFQAVADGTPWYGLRLVTTATGIQQFYASESGQPAWEFHITLSDLTDAPTNLRPDNGAVTTSTPILAWEAEDQVRRRVQVDTPAALADPDDVSPDYDSGWATTADLEFNLATSGHTPAGAGPHYWRVQVEAEGDETAPEWSDWAEFTVAALPSLIVDSPTGPFGDPTPTLLAHLATGTLESWKAEVTGPDRADVRVRTGVQTGPIEWTIPKRADGRRVIVEGEGGWIHLRAWDDTERAVAVGERDYMEAWIAAEFDDDLGVAAPGALSVVQYAAGDPRNVWRWTLAEAADAYLIQVDGRTVARLEPEDVAVSAGVYSWTDSGEVSPLRPHTLSVRAVDGNERSVAASVVDRSHVVKGMWLLPVDDDGRSDGEPMMFAGTPVGGFVNVGRHAVFQPHVGPPVYITYDANPGRTGVFQGSIDARQDVWAVVDQVEALKTSRRRLARMVWGSQSILARVLDADATSADGILPSNLEHDVSFTFVQQGD